MASNNYYQSASKLFSDGRVPLCKKCIKEMMPEDDIDKVQSTLRMIDKPFLIDIWNSSLASEADTVGTYMKNINSLPQYKHYTWDDSVLYEKERNKTVNVEKPNNSQKTSTNDIDSVDTEHGTITVTKELKSKWGNYTNREIIEMEKMYKDMELSNDISTPQHKKQLQFYCKLTLLMDKSLDEGDFAGYEKLSRQFDTLSKSSGFRPVDRKDGSEASGIRSFSQIYAEIEKDGWIEPYPITEAQDIVDRTIMYMENYQHKLYNMEQLYEPPQDTPKVNDGDTNG